MIDRKKFWSTSKKMLTYDNIQKIETSQVDDDIITRLCLFQKLLWNNSNLRKQQVLYAVSKAIQQINFTENLDRPGNTEMFFIIEEVRETILYFSHGNVR